MKVAGFAIAYAYDCFPGIDVIPKLKSAGNGSFRPHCQKQPFSPCAPNFVLYAPRFLSRNVNPSIVHSFASVSQICQDQMHFPSLHFSSENMPITAFPLVNLLPVVKVIFFPLSFTLESLINIQYILHFIQKQPSRMNIASAFCEFMRFARRKSNFLKLRKCNN